MSKVAIVVSPRVPVREWDAQIASGLETAKIRGLEEIAVLGDGVPALSGWANAPARQNSGLLVTPVTTDWASAQAVQQRNDALLKGSAAVVILGFVQTSSAKHAVGRAIAEGLTLVQIIDGAAEVIKSADLVRTAPGYEIQVPAALAEKASTTSPFARFMAQPQAKKSAKK